MKILLTPRFFLLWHARWERRLPPLPKKLPWHSMFSNLPPHHPQICSEMFWAILMRKPPFATADLCLKALDFLHFEIISSCNISLRPFLTLEMSKIVMLKVWRISYHQVFHFISASITLVDLHRNWLNWCHFLILTGSPLLILMDFMIFLSSYLGVTRKTMSTVFFLLHLDSAILYLQNIFL